MAACGEIRLTLSGDTDKIVQALTKADYAEAARALHGAIVACAIATTKAANADNGTGADDFAGATARLVEAAERLRFV